jgi:hypothetical protein
MAMTKTHILLFTLCIVSLSTARVIVSDDKPFKAPDGYVMISEDDWAYFIEDPAVYLKMGRESFLRNEYKSSALDLRKGAIYLKAEASRATDAGAKMLRDSASELESLARNMEQGRVQSVSRIDKTLSRAYYALSVHYYEIAEDARIRNDFKKVGRRTGASAYYLERALLRAGEKTESTTRNIVNRALEVAYKVWEGTGWTVEEVGRSMGDLGREIEKAGRRIQKEE